MVQWKEVLSQLTPDAEGRMDELRGRLYSQLGGVGPLKIIAFRGYGTPERLYLRGRVIEENTFLANEKHERVWADLVPIYTHAQCVQVPNASLAARFQNIEQFVTTDEDGFFEVRLEPSHPLADPRIWHPIEIQLVSPIPELQSRYPIKTTGEVLVPPVTAQYGVISNIDSILLPSNPSHLMYLARNAFLRSRHTRLSFPGEAALYQAFYGGLSGGEKNPIFYLSSNSSDLYDLLVQNINLLGLSSGPVLFTQNDKDNRIRKILALYPRLPFLLIGDSEQQDAEIYTNLAEKFPGRIPAIFIRTAGCDPQRMERIHRLAKRVERAGSRLVLAEHALTLASQAVDLGLLQTGALTSVVEDMRKDERPLSPLEKLISETRPRSANISNQAVKQGEAMPEGKEVARWQAQKQPVSQTRKKNK